MKKLAVSDAKLEVLKLNLKPPMYVLPAAMGGQEMKIDPMIGPDGYTIEMNIRILTNSQDQNPATGISTAISPFGTPDRCFWAPSLPKVFRDCSSITGS
ncbi:MAG: hypothetical protein IPK22_10910 [Verrucomicrobiaceae bacterium]|nr:hypothetical protein [Verrucomicrobiaceae bacterium]